MDAWYMIGAVIVTLVVCAIRFPTPSMHGAPRIIWTWRDKDTPLNPLTLSCRASWKRWNPDHVIRTLTPETFPQYARVPIEVASHPVLAPFLKDIVRLAVLVENGGIWLDSCVTLHGPLDAWLFHASLGTVHPKYEKMVGSMGPEDVCFLAALPGCTWARKWKDAWLELARYDSISSYVAIKKKEGVMINDLPSPLDSLHMITWRLLRAPEIMIPLPSVKAHLTMG